MPTINTIEPTPKHDPDEYLKKFITLVRIHAPKYDNFSLTDVKKKMELSKDERLIFRSLTVNNKISECLVDSGFANRKGTNLALTEKGRDIKNGKEEMIGISINNDFSNSTIGQVNQSLEKMEVKKNEIKQTVQPTKKPSIWARIMSFCAKFWWKILIPLALIVIKLMIDRGIIDIGI